MKSENDNKHQSSWKEMLYILNTLMSNRSFVWLSATLIAFVCLLISIPVKISFAILAGWIAVSTLIYFLKESN